MKTSIALDLGGTRIKAGLVQAGKILCTAQVDAFSDKGLLPRLPVIEETVDMLLKDQRLTASDISGIGISIPGIVDSRAMKLLSVNEKFNDAVDFNFPAWALKKWNLPLIIENDARCALVGEWQYGVGKGFDSLVMITLGTGVGGAALIEGKLLHGAHFQAGCLGGHFTINFQGSLCNCGNIGCVESEASSWKLPEKARQSPRFLTSELSKCDTIDYQQAFELSKKGDNLAGEMIHHSLEAWSAAVINLVHAYDPEMVILGGGIMKSHETILPFIKEKTDRHAWTPWGKVQIVCAENPEWSALQGLDYLLMKKHSVD